MAPLLLDVGSLLHDLVFDYTLRTVALGAMALGAVSGVLGSFAVLRRQSLLGDAISHAALPGIALAFLLTGSKATLVLVVGAAIAGWIGTLIVMAIVKETRVPEDAALGIVLSVFFGLGLVLLTFVQRRPDAAQAGLDTFLFGQAATLVGRDVLTIVGIGGIALLSVVLFWKEFKLLSFDPEFGASMGYPMQRIDVLLTTMLVLSIVIGLQTVGVVLMSAMIVAPAAGARQWTDRLGVMVLLAGVFGALAGLVGAVASSTARGIPTGPAIVLSVSTIVLLSLLFAPNRGLLAAAWTRRVNRRALRTEAVLLDLYALAAQHPPGAVHAHPISVLEALGVSRGNVPAALERLREDGYAEQPSAGTWHLTPAGRSQAEVLAAQRGTE
jgi:manganese/zinc/iron transport system permease protein